MFPRPPRWLLVGLGLLALGGCTYPVREAVDDTVCKLATHPIDPEPLSVAEPTPPPPPTPASKGTEEAPKAPSNPAPALVPLSFQIPQQGEKTPPGPVQRPEPLRIPPGLPGANAPEVKIKPVGPELEKQARELFPPLPEMGPNPQPVPGPNGRPLTLSQLQQLAMSNSPLLRQAAADVRAAEGAARQAGAYPNPTMGYEADTAGTGGTAGYQGAFFDQTIRTAGKLKLAQAMAVMDLENSKLALRRAQTDLEASVRSAYFAVLVAQENMRVSAALMELTDQAQRLHLLQFRKGIAAYYEPTQLRVYAFQARGALVTARNTYLAAWRALAAACGKPGMPPTELAGRADMPVPDYDWDQAATRVLRQHTDVLTAQYTERRARYNLRLQQVTPIPDVNTHLAVQKDYTTPPFSIVTTLQVGLPVPLWDQNQGAIVQAQGQLVRAVEEGHRVRDDLVTRLSDAYSRYRTNLVLVEYYRSHILPDSVRFYRGVYLRWHVAGGNVQFADVVNAQQTLGTAVATYITSLTALWQAVSDMASLLQTDDLFEVAKPRCPEPAPDVAALLEKLPCSHPCSPVADPVFKGAPLGWPAAAPPPAQAAQADTRAPEFVIPVSAPAAPSPGPPGCLPPAVDLPARPRPRGVTAPPGP
jgi:cobalt-zinc-cadmium efflux system outer membrane protein